MNLSQSTRGSGNLSKKTGNKNERQRDKEKKKYRPEGETKLETNKES
jgi:hypothetical protein